MRVSHSLVIIGLAFAVLGAAISPSNALNLDHPIPMGKTKKQKEREAAKKKASEERLEALKKLNALGGGPKKGKSQDDGMEALKKLNALGGGPKKGTQPKSLAGSDDVKGVKGVVTGNHLKGTSSTTRNGDWTSGGHGTPKTIAATTTNQILYRPVHSLGVKPSVPNTPQSQKR